MEKMPEPSLSEILDFALTLSDEAGRFILPLWKNVTVDHKSDGSEVTEADRGAEQLLRRRIAERFPDHAILGEEFGGAPDREAEHLWLLDPVDGAAPCARVLPLSGSLPASLRQREASLAVIRAHALGETLEAASGQGGGQRRHGSTAERVRTSAVQDLTKALVLPTGFEGTDV